MTPPGSASLLLAVFNTAAVGDAERDVARCCASRSLAAAIAAERPYDDFDALDAAIDAGFARLGWPDTAEALRGHPRIGDQDASGWSRTEQAGAVSAAQDVADQIAAGNRAYEERFGHVFLICATGLTGEQLLAALRERLGNDPDTERRVAADELRKITRLRMRKLLGG
ncbi:MAG: 2-oxo-4-hydroxy-4-carboxy-5-ureidoimidazoline decarboxylase [Streptosporangiaceae bacterium]